MEAIFDFKNNMAKTIFFIISLLSWLIFIITGWIGLLFLAIKNYHDDISYNNIWSFLSFYKKGNDIVHGLYSPIQADILLYILFFFILLGLGTAGFIVYLIKSTFKKEENIFEGLMGKFSRYHFIPLLCASAMFIVGMSQNLFLMDLSYDFESYDFRTFNDDRNKIKKYLACFAVNLSFSMIGLASLVFIKMKTELEKPLYIVYLIKDGFYSCLIVLFTYCFFYSSIYIGYYNKMNKAFSILKNNPINYAKTLSILNEIPNFLKDCGISFSLVVGIINLGFGIFLKDIGIPIMNLIVYLGLTIYFFNIKEVNGYTGVSFAEGAIDITILVLSVLLITYNGLNKFRPQTLDSLMSKI